MTKSFVLTPSISAIVVNLVHSPLLILSIVIHTSLSSDFIFRFFEFEHYKNNPFYIQEPLNMISQCVNPTWIRGHLTRTFTLNSSLNSNEVSQFLIWCSQLCQVELCACVVFCANSWDILDDDLLLQDKKTNRMPIKWLRSDNIKLTSLTNSVPSFL